MKILLFLAIILTACFKPIHAGELQFSVKNLSDVTGNRYFIMQRWLGVEVKYQPSEDSLYYFMSHDAGGLQTTYPAFDMSFTGVGFGFNSQVSTKVRLYGQLGYYFVDTSVKGRIKCATNKCEGLYYGLNDQWADLHTNGLVYFDEYEVKTKNGYGVTVGAEIIHKLGTNTNLVFNIERRSLYVQTMIAGMSKALWGDYDVTRQRWESHFKGIDSTNIGIGVNYSF